MQPPTKDTEFGTRRVRLQNAAAALLAFAVLCFALFPGHFDSDSAFMYGQSRDILAVSDANSPLLTFLMSATREFAPGPAILFTAQLGLWVFGLWLVTDALICAGHELVGPAVTLVCLTPLTAFIFLDVNKDTAMAAVGLVLIGWLTRLAFFGWRPTPFSWLCLGGLAVAFLSMRHNAFIALAPLVLTFVLLQWPDLQRSWGRGLLLSCAILLALMSTDHAFKYQVMGAQRSWGVRQLVMFDIAGITRYSGQDASSGLFGHDFRPDAVRCYSPKWHDPFEWGDCRDDGATLAGLVRTKAGREVMYRAWLKAVAGHPVSYLRHRVAHFRQLMQFACADCSTPMTTGAIWPRPWEPQPVRTSTSAILFEQFYKAVQRSVVARGWLWALASLACGGASILLLRRTQDRVLPLLILGVAGSALAYATAFLVIGIAYPSRYLHWTIMLGVIASGMTAGAVWKHRRALLRRSADEADRPDAEIVRTRQAAEAA
jgi:hypothetical protein